MTTKFIEVDGLKIIVDQHYSDEFTAIDDNTYDGPGSLIGSGKTSAEAVEDLREKFSEHRSEMRDRRSKINVDATNTDGYTFGGFVN